MNFFKTLSTLLASACFVGGVPASYAQPEPTQPEEIVVFDASTPLDSIRLQGVEVARGDDGSLVIRNDKTNPWPGIHFEGKVLDLSRYDAIVLDVRSASREKITLHCRLDCLGSDPVTLEGCVTQSISIDPEERVEWRVPLPKRINPETRAKLFAMRGLPGGEKTNDRTQSRSPFDKGAVSAIRPFETQNGRGDSWILEGIVAVPLDPDRLKSEEYLTWAPEKFFPMIDEFGQFKHADWPGKTHSLEELRAQIEVENADLAANQPTEFDRYGGWKNGPQLEATGSFRTEKIDGVWYLVDPDGRLFWSNGVDCLNFDTASTPLTDREFYFDPAIPTSLDSNSEFKRFLGVSNNSVNNYYADKGKFLVYNFTTSNLYKKFGENWREKWIDLSARRLRSWGLNTIGNWSDSRICRAAKIPYTATFNTASTSKTNVPRIEGSSGYWGKFVDPFHPAFAESLRQSLEDAKKRLADDPYCLGLFVDNEISWGEKGSLARAALLSPPDQEAKKAYLNWLKEKYGEIEKFNEAWRTNATSWDAILAEPFKTPDNATADADSDAFYVVLCEKYFSQIRDLIREILPGKLYLGCRFAWNNDLARAAGQKYCDVVSYNFYRATVDDFKPVEGAPDKPVIIGEFHFGALDRGLFHEGLGPRKDQNARAQAYEDYVRSALSNPWIVGAHWFEYQDEATTGRFDGENYQIGLIDVCDRPYKETIEAVRRVGYDLYRIRQETAKRK